jgi:hypothetical protein
MDILLPKYTMTPAPRKLHQPSQSSCVCCSLAEGQLGNIGNHTPTRTRTVLGNTQCSFTASFKLIYICIYVYVCARDVLRSQCAVSCQAQVAYTLTVQLEDSNVWYTLMKLRNVCNTG